MIKYKESWRMVTLDRKKNEFLEFRNKKVLADYLGASKDTVIGWFRKNEAGLMPKTKIYNGIEIISIDGEYLTQRDPDRPNNLVK